MALLRLELKNYNKGNATTPPVGAYAQYLLGPSIAAHAAHNLRERLEEMPREDLIAAGHQYMPLWAQGKEQTFWENADTHSRKNGVLGKEILLTLPREFDRAHNQALLNQFLATLPRCPTTWVFHETVTRGRTAIQPHAHILCSPRQDRQHGQDPAKYFKAPHHGGVPSVRLWTKREEVFALRAQWEQMLRASLRMQGLEQTLERPYKEKEIRLSVTEMKALERFIAREMPRVWGQEHMLPPTQLKQWRDAGDITTRQATFLQQRGQRHRYWELGKEQPKVWEATRQVERTSRWHPIARHRAVKTQEAVRKRVQVLERRTAQSASLHRDTLQPALHQEKARYHREKALEREAQRRGRSRGKGREVHGAAGGLQADLGNALDEQRRRRTREQDREHEAWER